MGQETEIAHFEKKLTMMVDYYHKNGLLTPRNQTSGLAQAVRLLKKTEGIDIVELTIVDIIRHQLVKAIIEQYEEDTIRKG